MPDEKRPRPSCATCPHPNNERACVSSDGLTCSGCPTVANRDLLARANQEYEKPEVRHFARQTSIQEAECYANRDQQPYVMQPTKTRIVETAEFAARMGYRKLGLAFCIGLAWEASMVADVLTKRGFEVVSAACKAGHTEKEFLGLGEEHKIYRGTDEAICNPIYQAMLLNEAGAEFNILLGLCVGHDSLFLRYAQAPVTVLAVKDRVTGHNPLAALYLSGSYYRKIEEPDL